MLNFLSNLPEIKYSDDLVLSDMSQAKNDAKSVMNDAFRIRFTKLLKLMDKTNYIISILLIWLKKPKVSDVFWYGWPTRIEVAIRSCGFVFSDARLS